MTNRDNVWALQNFKNIYKNSGCAREAVGVIWSIQPHGGFANLQGTVKWEGWHKLEICKSSTCKMLAIKHS